MPFKDNIKTDLMLVITALLFFIFATGRASPSTVVPDLIVAPP